MTIYRTQPSSPAEIVLQVHRAGFPARLWLTFKQRRSTLAIFGLCPLVMPIGLALMIIGGDTTRYAFSVFKWGAIFGEMIFFAPVLVSTVLRAIPQNDAEKLLPRRLVLREDAIEVTPASGAPTVERWTWIPLAREASTGFVLVLSENPYVEVGVPFGILQAAQVEQLRTWLRVNECLPREVRAA